MIRSRLVCLKHITYAVITLALCVCGLEVGLRVYDSYASEVGQSAGAADPLLVDCWWTHHRLQPLRDVVSTHPDTLEPLTFRTNSTGLRGAEVAVPKPPGLFRVVCLGDENTFAQETDQRETFCAHLENLLQDKCQLRVEVINAGVPGYCPLLEFLQVRHLLVALEPDLLILNFDMTDIADDHRYRRYLQLDGSLPLACPHPNLARTHNGSEEPRGLRLLTPTWCKKRLGRFFGTVESPEDRRDIDTPHGVYAWLRDDPPNWSLYIEQALAPVGELNQLAVEMYSPLLLAVVPAPWQISQAACSGSDARQQAGVPANTVYKNPRPFEILEQYARQQQIRFCDASHLFMQVERPERLYLHNAPRLSPDGHLLYARVLEQAILQTVPGAWSDHSQELLPRWPVREAGHEVVPRESQH